MHENQEFITSCQIRRKIHDVVNRQSDAQKIGNARYLTAEFDR